MATPLDGATVLLAVALMFCLAGASAQTEDRAQAGNETVTMIMVRPNFDTEVEVPVGYLGPRFLELSKQNLEGGKQRRFLIQFYYPSMQPNVRENAHLRNDELLLYASVTTGTPGAFGRILQQGAINNDYIEPTGKEQCGFKEFLWLGRHHYFHRDVLTESPSYRAEGEKFLGDVSVSCGLASNSGEDTSCRFSFDLDPQYVTVNGVPKSKLCEWPELRDSVRELTETFFTVEDQIDASPSP